MVAPRNRSLVLTSDEERRYAAETGALAAPATVEQVLDRVFCQDVHDFARVLPREFVDLLVLDPPYNLDKIYCDRRFHQMQSHAYEQWLEEWLAPLIPTLRPTASIYFCCDW